MSPAKSEKDFQAEFDANTLGEAAAIRADPSRMKAARPEIRKLAKETENKARGLRAAAGPSKKTASKKKATTKKTSRKATPKKGRR